MAQVRRRLNQEEQARQHALDVREQQANSVLSNESTSVTAKENARRHLKNVKRERAALEAQIASRVAARRDQAHAVESDELLSQIEADFPPVKPAAKTDWAAKIAGSSETTVEESLPVQSVEELTEQLSRVRERLNSLEQTPATKAARIYLLDQSNTLRELLTAAKEQEKEQTRLAKQQQAERDAAAGDAAVREWREKLDTRLASGFLPLSDREVIRNNFVNVAAQYRAKQREAGNAIESGVHVAAILAAKAEFFEQSASRLAIYDCDLIHPETISEADAKLFEGGWIFSAANFNFRTRDEKAKLVWRARRYFQATSNVVGLSRLPTGVPEPIVIPNKPPVPLESIEQRDMQQLLDALKPLEDQSLEIIYRVETANLDNPNSEPLLLWPDGRAVDIHKEVLWDKKSAGFRRVPEPAEIIEPKWGGAQRTEWVQDVRGEWVQQVINDSPETYEQDLTGTFVRKANGQWKQQPLIQIKEGAHKPLDSDPRKFFRAGSWWTKEDIEQADRVTFNLKMAETGPGVADQTVWPRNAATPISSEEANFCWRKHEMKIKSELKEREKQHV